MAAPIPVEPPVTIARLPLRSAMPPPLDHIAPRQRIEGLEPHRPALTLQADQDPWPLALAHREIQAQRPEEIAERRRLGRYELDPRQASAARGRCGGMRAVAPIDE